MSRLNKFMVYNPKKGKPVKYYSRLNTALEVADKIKNEEKEDVLVLQVIYIAQYKCDSQIKKIKEIINSTDWSQCQRCDGCGLDNGCLDEDCATYKVRKKNEECKRHELKERVK